MNNYFQSKASLQPKKDRTRAAIIDSAINIIAKKGFQKSSIQEMAKNAGIAKSTLTGILTTLEKHGYCRKEPHSDDGRRVVVHITQAGENLMEEVFPKFHEIENLAVSELTGDDFETTKDSLRTMLRTMEKLTKQSKSE